jgi:hypothetical protein
MAEIELRLNPARDIIQIKALRLGRQTSNGLMTNPATGFASRNRRDVINRATVGNCTNAAIVRKRIRKGWTLNDALNTSACSNAFPAGGLQHYWSLNETSGTRQDTVGTIALTESGTVESATGIRGFAANGNNQTDSLDSAASITISAPVSFVMWMNMVAFHGTIGIPFQAGNVQIQYDNVGDLRFVGAATYLTRALGTVGAWHLVVLTIDTSNVWRASVDGLAFTSAQGNAPTSGSLSLLGSTTINGLIDEVAHYNRALTQDEVNNIWNGGTGRFL